MKKKKKNFFFHPKKKKRKQNGTRQGQHTNYSQGLISSVGNYTGVLGGRIVVLRIVERKREREKEREGRRKKEEGK